MTATPTDRREHLDERSIILITSLGHALCHIGEWIIPGAILSIESEFTLDPFGSATLVFLAGFLMGAGAVPVGAWSDRRGPARLLRFYFAALAAAALAVTACTRTWHLFVALTFLGLVLSIYHPAGLAMISLGCKARGRAMGINGMAGSVGVAGGAFLGGVFASLGLWRLAFVVLAALSVASLGLMALARRRAARRGLVPAEDPLPLPAPATDGKAEERPAPRWRRYLPLALLLGTMMLGGFNYSSLKTVLSPYLNGEEAVKASAFGSVKALLVLLLGGCAGQFLGGWASDRHGPRVYLLFIGMLLPLGLLLGLLEGTTLLALLAASFLAVNMFAQQPVENSILAGWTSQRRRSLSYGAKFTLTFGLAQAGALVAGTVRKGTGSSAPVFFLLAGSAAVMFPLCLTALRRRQRDAAAGTPTAAPGVKGVAEVESSSEAAALTERSI